jgi:hypothetical protein
MSSGVVPLRITDEAQEAVFVGSHRLVPQPTVFHTDTAGLEFTARVMLDMVKAAMNKSIITVTGRLYHKSLTIKDQSRMQTNL